MAKTVLISTLAIGLLMIPFLIHAEVYKWVEVYKWIDDKGTIHFTDDYSIIPEKNRQQVERKSLPEGSKPMTEGEKTESNTIGITLSNPVMQDIPLLVSGMISTVGSETIVVTGEGKDMVFVVSEDTSIKTDYGNKVSFGELKNGQRVTVEYIKKGDDNRARTVTVSILEAGATNAVVGNKAGVGQLQNPGEIQKSVWQSQKRFKLQATPKK
jgi:hypothetical protein